MSLRVGLVPVESRLRPGIEHRYLDCTIHSLVNISMKPSRIIVTDIKIKLFLPRFEGIRED
jgi:hypothetical protein